MPGGTSGAQASAAAGPKAKPQPEAERVDGPKAKPKMEAANILIARGRLAAQAQVSLMAAKAKSVAAAAQAAMPAVASQPAMPAVTTMGPPAVVPPRSPHPAPYGFRSYGTSCPQKCNVPILGYQACCTPDARSGIR